MFFRVAALLSYLLCYFISDSFVLNFILIVLLLSFESVPTCLIFLVYWVSVTMVR